MLRQLNVLVNGIFILAVLLSVLVISSLQDPLVQTNSFKSFTFSYTWCTNFFHLGYHFTNGTTAYTFFSSGHHLTISTVAPAGIEISADRWW